MTQQQTYIYVELYAWYPIPASVHKMLLHGSVVVESFLLPIGMLSEEDQESQNKDVRAVSATLERTSDTMADQFRYLLL